MPVLYEPHIEYPAGTIQLDGTLKFKVIEKLGLSQAPSNVIRNDSDWEVEVTLETRGLQAGSLPTPVPGYKWEFRAYLDSLTGTFPEQQVGIKSTDITAGLTGVDAAGLPTCTWTATIPVKKGAIDLSPDQYEVCRLTVAAITVDAAGHPIHNAHFATEEAVVAVYKPGP